MSLAAFCAKAQLNDAVRSPVNEEYRIEDPAAA